NNRFERSFLAERRGVFGADGVEVFLGFAFGRTLCLQGSAQARDLGGQAAGTLGNALEFQSDLSTLAAKGLRLGRSVRDFSLQPMFFPSNASQSFVGLRELIAQIGSSPDSFENGHSMRFLLLLEPRKIDGGVRRFLQTRLM